MMLSVVQSRVSPRHSGEVPSLQITQYRKSISLSALAEIVDKIAVGVWVTDALQIKL
jgi:hypothetical protein